MSGIKTKTAVLGGTELTLNTPVFGWVRLTAHLQEVVRQKFAETNSQPMQVLADQVVFDAMCAVIASATIPWTKDSPQAALDAKSAEIADLANGCPGLEGLKQLMEAYTAACEVTYPEAFEKKAAAQPEGETTTVQA